MAGVLTVGAGVLGGIKHRRSRNFANASVTEPIGKRTSLVDFVPNHAVPMGCRRGPRTQGYWWASNFPREPARPHASMGLGTGPLGHPLLVLDQALESTAGVPQRSAEVPVSFHVPRGAHMAWPHKLWGGGSGKEARFHLPGGSLSDMLGWGASGKEAWVPFQRTLLFSLSQQLSFRQSWLQWRPHRPPHLGTKVQASYAAVI